ncbi:aminoglycoside phosphotransferase (APT) family kinase protein [Silvimonas terrae]|uniref:Aminoglycoside phosphotransferase (APT) family kinase protein n=1 Tax=Silvimonas terrae TaxID=300266 RepID=A0A840RH68_9NEIS|nr:phosphotransferase [Silvimonas terrae]MBB5191924.1 aminoglycoside phosphotransferase (APT) family kinase protein [Silvimonas terrae]
MPLPEHLLPLATRFLGGIPLDAAKIDGFYAEVWLLRGPQQRQVVLKCFRQPGNASRETLALHTLRAAGGAVLPQVLGKGLDETGREVLVLERLDGVDACAAIQSPEAMTRFADRVTDILLHWHGVTSPLGFQDIDGSFRPGFVPSWQRFAQDRLAWLFSAAGEARTTLPMRQHFERIWRIADALVRPLADDISSLIHDDCHASNFLADPLTQTLTAVIDPNHARFAHREFDLFHLNDARPEFRLLETYLEKHPAAPGFGARRYLFSLFDDLKHVQYTGWFDHDWFMRKFAQFDEARARVA